MTTFGSGFCDSDDSFRCGQAAAEKAMQSAGLSKGEVELCFLFCTSRHDAYRFSEGVKSVVGETRCIGGYSNGAIDNEHVGYDGYQAVVGVLRADQTKIDLFLQQGVAFNEYAAGKGLARQISDRGYGDDAHMLLLFDAVNRQKGYFQMNYGTPFLNGMIEVLEEWPNVAGARLMGDMRFKPTYQWFEDQVVQDAAMALVFTGGLDMDVQVMHGCTPASAYHKVTKTKGSVILEIDHQPALDFVGNIFGEELADNYAKLKFFVTMGKNLGDKWADFNATDYANRMCVGIDKDQRGLKMAEIDLDEGAEFQLMRRGFEMEYIENQVSEVIERVLVTGRRPVFALYLNCAGRAAAYSGNTEEDAHRIQRVIAGRFPIIGIYEAGELAKVAGDLQVLDWTGIFCLFSQKE